MNASTSSAPPAPASGRDKPAPPTPVALGASDLRSAFTQRALYPVDLAPGAAFRPAIELFRHWMDVMGQTFNGAASPWLPVGRVGPLLVLGHCQPDQPPSLPPHWYQPVLLAPAAYERHLRLCVEAIGRADAPDWDNGEMAAPRRLFPGADPALVRPTTFRAALRFLIEYFPQRRSDLLQVQELLVRSDQIAESELPAGYLGACWTLLERGGVADPTVIAPPVTVVTRLPPPLAERVRVISEHAQTLWVGLERLPQPDIEDMLLNELGEGWQVRFLLVDAPRLLCPAPSSAAGVTHRPEEPEARPGRRARMKIEDARTRARAADAPEPGVIRLTQKDLRELDSYNPRRPDRDPVKVFLKQLSAGIRNLATDLHIEPGLESYRVRARIDGYLEEWLEMPADFGRMVVGAAKEQFGMPPERWLPQDGACTVYHGGDTVNLRVAAYPIRGTGQKLAIRYLPRRGDVPPLDHLMSRREAALVRRAISRPYGLILLCGPTGSGKTTTTFSALGEINTPDINITTMEDPVEYEMDGVNQAELDRVRGVDWDALLSGFLRQDPDVGMVGEIRDRETAETAIRLTLTGHIVFATLHTLSCAHTVERLVDTGVNAPMLANAATLIISQRLVRRLCRRCKHAGRRPTSEVEKKLFERHGVEIPAAVFDAVGGGCEECRRTGYKGQMGAFEMLPVTEEVAQLIAERRSVRAIEEWMRRNGFPRVYASALALAARGETSLAEANQWQAAWEELPATEAGAVNFKP